MRSGRERGGPGDDVGQRGDAVVQGEAVEEIVPEADAEFLAGLFQAGEGIAGTSTVVRAGGAGDFSFDDVLADVALAEVVVQRDVGTFEDQEQLGFVVAQTFERLVQGLEVGLGAAQFIEAGVDLELGLVVGVELVVFEVVVEVPELGALLIVGRYHQLSG